jgi:hypothetical protein
MVAHPRELPTTEPPSAAWTIQLNGKTYSLTVIGRHIYAIWLGTERLGSFEFLPDTGQGPAVRALLPPELRAVAAAFLRAYREENAL